MARRDARDPRDRPRGPAEMPADGADDRAVYVISVAAELAGVHPQTLRIYERRGLVSPARTAGNTRRYSAADIARLRAIQRLTQEFGVNLAGVQMIMEMADEAERLRRRSEELARALERMERERPRTEIVPRRSGPRVLWRAPAAGQDGALEPTIG